MSVTYNSYLKLDKLLNLQETRSQPVEHDEILFIIIHQTYELWFKQILHEFTMLRTQLESGNTWNAIRLMERILVILKIAVAQTDILETMTPLSFNHFRKFLDNASGFESIQFREIEVMCGLRYPKIYRLLDEDDDRYNRLRERMSEHTLWESFCILLQKNGYDVQLPERQNEHGLLFKPNAALQDILVGIMKTDPETALLCEHLVDFDEGLQEWRYRHLKMVERTIGTKQGTGGSDGAGYLRKTLHQTIFPDLWAIRTKL